MQIEVTPHARQIIEQLVATGQVDTPAEAVDAMASLWADNVSQTGPTIESLKALVDEGRREGERGEDSDLDMDEIKSDLRRWHAAKVEN